MKLSNTPEWLPAFPGANHSFLDCEVIGLEKIDACAINLHWQSTGDIWFDYVRLHPVKSMYYMANCYSKAYGRYLESNIDFDMRFSKGFKGDALDSKELRQFLAVKKLADTDSMPYDFWMQEAFKHFESIGWIRPPRPSHLLSESAHFRDKMIQARADRMEEMTLFSKDPWFSAAEWIAHPQQIRYEEWIVQNIGLRQHKEFALSVALYDLGHLRIERAIQSFGLPLVKKAQDWYGQTG